MRVLLLLCVMLCVGAQRVAIRPNATKGELGVLLAGRIRAAMREIQGLLSDVAAIELAAPSARVFHRRELKSAVSVLQPFRRELETTPEPFRRELEEEPATSPPSGWTEAPDGV